VAESSDGVCGVLVPTNRNSQTSEPTTGILLGLITSPRFQDWSPEQPSPSDDLLVQQVGYLPSYAITLPQILPNTLEQSLQLAGSEPGIASSAECFQVEALQDNNVNL
jgi:hypothetical protein